MSGKINEFLWRKLENRAENEPQEGSWNAGLEFGV
jgi:hypothetical protein